MDHKQKRLFSDEEILSWIGEVTDQEINEVHQKSLVPFYDQIWESGDSSYLKQYKTDKEFLDCTSQAWTSNIGFSNPDVAFAVSHQLKTLSHVRYGFATKPRIKFIHKITSLTPGNLKKVAANAMGGGASIEAALRLAMINKPGAQQFYTYTRSYHGSSLATMSLSTRFAGVTRFKPWGLDRVAKIPFPYCYRCPMGQEGENKCNLECLELAQNLIEYGSVDKVCGILMEPIQGPGGHVPAPKRYIRELRKWTEKNEIFFIWDESQLFTRIGHWFTSEYYEGVTPDITCLTKAIGGSLPMGVTIAREDINGFNSAEEHSTFGANPLMFAASMVFMNYVERADLLKNTREQGDYITSKLRNLQKRYDYIGDIRCPGLMIGIELVNDPETKTPGNTLAADLVEEAMDQRVIFGLMAPISTDSGKLFRNVVKIKPPLIITREESDHILNVFESSLEEAIDYL
ncbi:MAG: aminotransferase class III-fold pyridoxal phosphate-dependent enzyme [Candidatus Heimdallarchaeota archaeon]|nr:aminotransferase class III-fold pyridoxal phosphate-dependent enzyme [Candidatus Heimdallarchaeota archaeon]